MTVDPIKIRAPYEKTDKTEIEQPAIVSMDWSPVDGVSSWELFTKFWQGKKQDPDGVGWQSGAEMMALDRLIKLANNIIDKKSRYEAASRSKIVDLAKAAKTQLIYISSRYDHWHNRGLPAKAPYSPQRLSLYRSKADIDQYLDPKRDYGLWWPVRDAERARVRKAWDKALRFLWCAVYGANQSKAYLKNKELATEGLVLKGAIVMPTLKAKRVVKKVVLIPTTAEPDFVPGMPMPEEEGEVVEEEPVVEKPKKKKGMGLVIAVAAAVALLAMKR
jgi:hypothetical protein